MKRLLIHLKTCLVFLLLLCLLVSCGSVDNDNSAENAGDNTAGTGENSGSDKNPGGSDTQAPDTEKEDDTDGEQGGETVETVAFRDGFRVTEPVGIKPADRLAFTGDKIECDIDEVALTVYFGCDLEGYRKYDLNTGESFYLRIYDPYGYGTAEKVIKTYDRTFASEELNYAVEDGVYKFSYSEELTLSADSFNAPVGEVGKMHISLYGSVDGGRNIKQEDGSLFNYPFVGNKIYFAGRTLYYKRISEDRVILGYSAFDGYDIETDSGIAPVANSVTPGDIEYALSSGFRYEWEPGTQFGMSNPYRVAVGLEETEFASDSVALDIYYGYIGGNREETKDIYTSNEYVITMSNNSDSETARVLVRRVYENIYSDKYAVETTAYENACEYSFAYGERLTVPAELFVGEEGEIYISFEGWNNTMHQLFGGGVTLYYRAEGGTVTITDVRVSM